MTTKEKVVIVTGANTGIGKETVRRLAREGAKIYMACRNLEKGQQACDEIMDETMNSNIHCRECDLADFESIRKFATYFLKKEEKLDILINNAGVMCGQRQTTKQGIELQFGVNHLGHFLLTNLLLEILKVSAPSRVIVVSSSTHSRGRINFDDLNSEKSYRFMGAYAQSKLANILFTKELARQLHGTGVTVNCLHPGLVATEIGRNAGWSNKMARFCLLPFMKTPAQGAETTLYVALNSKLNGVTGTYFSDSKETHVARQGDDLEAATKLWAVSSDMIAQNPKI